MLGQIGDALRVAMSNGLPGIYWGCLETQELQELQEPGQELQELQDFQEHRMPNYNGLKTIQQSQQRRHK